MTVDQAIRDISTLPPLDQMRIVQAIWDKLPEAFGTELSSAQCEKLNRRWDEYKLDPRSALTEDEFREQLRLARRR